MVVSARDLALTITQVIDSNGKQAAFSVPVAPFDTIASVVFFLEKRLICRNMWDMAAPPAAGKGWIE